MNYHQTHLEDATKIFKNPSHFLGLLCQVATHHFNLESGVVSLGPEVGLVDWFSQKRSCKPGHDSSRFTHEKLGARRS